MERDDESAAAFRPATFEGIFLYGRGLLSLQCRMVRKLRKYFIAKAVYGKLCGLR